MNHNRSINNNINRIHERALRILYEDKKSTFKKLLEKDNSETIHVKNLQELVTEMYIVQNIIQLSNTSDFTASRTKTVRYGWESLSYLGPKLWNILLDEYKKIQSVKDFKGNIRS